MRVLRRWEPNYHHLAQEQPRWWTVLSVRRFAVFVTCEKPRRDCYQSRDLAHAGDGSSYVDRDGCLPLHSGLSTEGGPASDEHGTSTNRSYASPDGALSTVGNAPSDGVGRHLA